jgi:hypothetical protein
MKAFDHPDLILTYSASLCRLGIQVPVETLWIPAFAGMTEKNFNIDMRKKTEMSHNQ